ncbi:MAG: hypothetical protein AAGH89_01020 [Verrucomicrobiota bacterium]
MIKEPLFIIAAIMLTFAANSFAEVRMWTNKNGVSLEAEYLSQADGVVNVRRISNGRE